VAAVAGLRMQNDSIDERGHVSTSQIKD
jgi:hypothetical protein